MRLNVLATGIAFSIFLGLVLFLLLWWIMAFEGATGEPAPGAAVYRGYTVSPLGSLIGLAWGIGDGFIDGVVLAWLYNTAAALLHARSDKAAATDRRPAE